MVNFTGTAGKDSFTGTSGDDFFDMLAGDDTVHAGLGNDTIYGGEGNDTLDGGGGNDIIYGGDGNDTLIGGYGNDSVYGGAGNDTITFRQPSGTAEFTALDVFSGGDGFDTLALYGGANNAVIYDFTTYTINSDIEAIDASTWTYLTASQVSAFASVRGYLKISGAVSLDFSNGRYKGGFLFLGSGDDFVSLAGNVYEGTSAMVRGGGGNDHIIGSESSDSLSGEDGNDLVEGGGGDDSIDDGFGDDVILGGEGNDSFFGNFGTDVLDGGAGNDTFNLNLKGGFGSEDSILGGAGFDTLYLVQNSDGTYLDFSEFSVTGIERFEGGNASFIMSIAQVGQFDSLTLSGLKIADGGTLAVGSGLQVGTFILSDQGNSIDVSSRQSSTWVTGGLGNDQIVGTGFEDRLVGGGGDDVISGGGGQDDLAGGAGVDWLIGGTGNDRFFVQSGETISAGDRFTGGSGTDTLIIGQDLTGGWGPADPGVFDLTGAIIDAGMEILAGGFVKMTIAQVGVFQQISAGLVLADGGVVDFTAIVFGGNLTLSDASTTVTANGGYGLRIAGGAGDDVMIGSTQANEDNFVGGAGDDQLLGGGGDDVLDGGTGADSMDGGAGNDLLWVDNVGDIAIDTGGGRDKVFSSVSLTMGQGIDDLYLTGSDALNATGNSLNNEITGNAADNLINGGAGVDYMWGGAGNDTYIVDDVLDAVFEWSTQDVDEVRSSVSYVLPTFAEKLTLTGDAAINGTGSDLSDQITGNGATNILSGGSAHDKLFGVGGDDILEGGDGDDTLDGGQGSDTASYEHSFEGINVSLALTGAQNTGWANVDTLINIENLLGSAHADKLTGNALANKIDGGAGNDLIEGGAGDDLLDGGVGFDTATYASATGAVTINLSLTGAQNTGAAGWDTLVNIEQIVGSNSADILTGNLFGNMLRGGAGNDQIDGGDGNDLLEGGDGNDVLTGGAGFDTATYENATAKVALNLSLTTAQATGSQGSDTLTGIEGLIGSAFNDTLTGNGDDNRFEGGAGNDAINGGAGSDTAAYVTANSAVTLNLASTLAQNTVGAGSDTLTSIENLIGSAFNDQLTGDGNDNVIEGGQGDDTVNGGSGNDTASYAGTFVGVTVNLSLAGAQDTNGAGLDTLIGIENLTGSAGADFLSGNSNANILSGLNGNDSIDGGDGQDRLFGGTGNDLLLGGIGDDRLEGDDGLDQLEGGAGADVILGGAGSDILVGGGGIDQLNGGDGGDVYILSSLVDYSAAEIADDGADGVDELRFAGSSGQTLQLFANDTGLERITLGTGTGEQADSTGTAAVNVDVSASANGLNVVGNAGHNIVRGSAFADVVSGAAGNDQLLGAAGNDSLDGGLGNDRLLGELGNDTLLGGAGVDFLDGGEGVDQQNGGDAGDLYFVSAAAHHTAAEFGDDGPDGNDEIRFATSVGETLKLYVGDTGLERAVIGTGTGTQADLTGLVAANIDASAVGNALTMVGNAGDNILTGTGFGDTIQGGLGIDRLVGNGGNDTLDGGVGADRFFGGTGDDRYFVDNVSDVVVELAGEGIDTVVTSAAHTMRDNVENLEIAGIYSLNATGNAIANLMTGNAGANKLYGMAGDDVLVGNDGNDTLDGGAGADRMTGGLGNENYYVDDAGDVVIELAGQGTDTIRTTLGVTLAANVENLILLGDSGISGDGNALANIITGNAGANVLKGHDGIDRLMGGGGNDTLDGGTGNDRLYGGTGDDIFYVDASTDLVFEFAGEGIDTVVSGVTLTALRANVENLIQTGTANIGGTGNELANDLQGNSGANMLAGGAGNDMLGGNAGADVLKGEDGNDILDGGSARDRFYGGTGADQFRFKDGDFSGVTSSSADQVHDFSQAEGDRVDLSAIDADIALAGNQAFAFIGSGAFSGVAGQLRYQQISGNTYVQGDTNGDGQADFWIRLDGTHNLTTGDFLF